MTNLTIIQRNIQDSINLKTSVLQDVEILQTIDEITTQLVHCYRNSGKVLFCGNGGSAADAQHLATELSGRYYYDRPALNAEALHVNGSYITAVANDYSYEKIYERLISGIAHQGDILIGMSTSGNSQNVILALQEAKAKGVTTIGFTGKSGGNMKEHCDYLICIDSGDTPRIQECHLMIGHAICEIVESTLFPQN